MMRDHTESLAPALPERGSRLAEACALLDPAEEARLAEEGMQSDADAWPLY